MGKEGKEGEQSSAWRGRNSSEWGAPVEVVFIMTAHHKKGSPNGIR
jgi:hypothetical protein